MPAPEASAVLATDGNHRANCCAAGVTPSSAPMTPANQPSKLVGESRGRLDFGVVSELRIPRLLKGTSANTRLPHTARRNQPGRNDRPRPQLRPPVFSPASTRPCPETAQAYAYAPDARRRQIRARQLRSRVSCAPSRSTSYRREPRRTVGCQSAPGTAPGRVKMRRPDRDDGPDDQPVTGSVVGIGVGTGAGRGRLWCRL
jgi:hypothetical protein